MTSIDGSVSVAEIRRWLGSNGSSSDSLLAKGSSQGLMLLFCYYCCYFSFLILIARFVILDR